ncbi:hypothetical protein MHK_006563 [Candidatus Magnetomorum sp. HK-1]|nr:hypothetical protein MHK_006563 [Candidatus Magnetomorum sp. HK-1]
MKYFQTISIYFVLGLIPCQMLEATDNIIKTGNIAINKQTKIITIQSRLAIKKGILEYLLVGDHGKTYESLLKVSDTKPSDFNFALLLIGCEPLDYQKFIKIKNQKNGIDILKKKYPNSLLNITIVNKNRATDLNKLINNRETKNNSFFWVYTGGYFFKDNRYAGDLEMSFIGIWSDRLAVVNLCSHLKNPYHGNFGYEAYIQNERFNVNDVFELIIKR